MTELLTLSELKANRIIFTGGGSAVRHVYYGTWSEVRAFCESHYLPGGYQIKLASDIEDTKDGIAEMLNNMRGQDANQI